MTSTSINALTTLPPATCSLDDVIDFTSSRVDTNTYYHQFATSSSVTVWSTFPVRAEKIDGDWPWMACTENGHVTGVKYKNLWMPMDCITRLMDEHPILQWPAVLHPQWKDDLYYLAVRDLLLK